MGQKIRGGGAKISWGGIFGAKQLGMWRLAGGDLGEQQEAAKCSHSMDLVDQLCIEHHREEGRKVDWDNYAESSLRYAWGKGRAAEVRERVSRGSRSVKCPSSA